MKNLLIIIIMTVMFCSIIWFSIVNMFVIGEINHIYMQINSKDFDTILSNDLFTSSIRNWYLNIFVYFVGFICLISSILTKRSIITTNIIYIVQYFLTIIITGITISLSFSFSEKINLFPIIISLFVFMVSLNIVLLILKKQENSK